MDAANHRKYLDPISARAIEHQGDEDHGTEFWIIADCRKCQGTHFVTEV